MNKDIIRSGCACGAFNRRSFLAGVCSCASLEAFTFTGKRLFAEDKKDAVRVRLVFSLESTVQQKPDWPGIGFDFAPIMTEMTDGLNAGVDGVEFLPVTAHNGEDARNIVKADAESGEIAGYVVIQMNSWTDTIHDIADSGKPVLFYDYPFAGSAGLLVYSADLMRKETKNFAFISTSRFDDVVGAAALFGLAREGKTPEAIAAAMNQYRIDHTKQVEPIDCKEDALVCLSPEETLAKLKGMKLIVVGNPWPDCRDALADVFGMEVLQLEFAELNDAWEKADPEEAKKIVLRWRGTAEQVIDITDETLFDSARMFLGMRSLLVRHGAHGISVNCLDGFYGGHIHAYPCLGFAELCNEGFVGGCECDLRSASTMMILSVLTGGRTGFISDPVMDCATKTITYAHCSSSYKAFGPDGPVNPFTIMSHSEDRKGASPRSTLPVGYMTTTLEIDSGCHSILMHRSKAVGNNTCDRACRTKLVGEVAGDFEQLYRGWDIWGWHRVTVYGDVTEAVRALAEKIGFSVYEDA